MFFGMVIAAVALMSYSTHDPVPVTAGRQAQVIQTAQEQGPATPSKQQFPHMELEKQYAGPLPDTIIQRWRDPVYGTICYLYLPILVHHSPPTENGFVEYGANGVGSISCMPGPGVPGAARH